MNEEIPAGVSIESASYIENNSDTKIDETVLVDNSRVENTVEEESFLCYFQMIKVNKVQNQNFDHSDESQQLFDQETNEDEDFEIPAF